MTYVPVLRPSAMKRRLKPMGVLPSVLFSLQSKKRQSLEEVMKDIDIRGTILRRITLGSFDNNVYFLLDPKNHESIVIDAAADADRILQSVTGTHVRCILQTHCHMDHIMALDEVRRGTGARVGIHPADEKTFRVRADFHLKDNQILEIGQLKIRVIHTPGHTPGGVCFLIEHHLISGDTLFQGGPGKTGSPEDFEQLLESITEKIYRLPDDTICHPGHGSGTTVGESKKDYQVFAAKKRTRPVYGDVEWLGS
jgi:glyoxylase-like metal-dependent hydrolase (beta-lactamase superfamily II)